MEFIEDFHFKYMFYIFQLLPIVFKSNCWPVLSMVLEMFAYRLHYIQAPLRLQLLNTLQQGWIRMNFISVCKTPQLNVLIETTTLKLITGLGNTGLVISSTHLGFLQSRISEKRAFFTNSDFRVCQLFLTGLLGPATYPLHGS